MTETRSRDEMPSCLVCGQQSATYGVVHGPSGVFACKVCVAKAAAVSIGFVLAKYYKGDATPAVSNSRIYRTRTHAQHALDGKVWHNRDGWMIQEVFCTEAAHG